MIFFCDYLPVFGEATGGSGTSDHSQLTNLDYANSGHTGFMSSSNYIPANTTYTVKTDGTGDFSKLSEAIAFLQNKWSPFLITISIGAGTFVENDLISIKDTLHSGITTLVIEGAGVDSTIIQNTSTKIAFEVRDMINSNILIKNLTIENTNETTPVAVLYNASSKRLRVNNIKLIKGQSGFLIGGSLPEATLEGTLTIQNCTSKGIDVQNGGIFRGGSQDISFSNIPLGIGVARQSKIILNSPNWVWTSVTTKANISINTYTADGYIYTDTGTI